MLQRGFSTGLRMKLSLKSSVAKQLNFESSRFKPVLAAFRRATT